MRQVLMQRYRDWITPSLVENFEGLSCWPGTLDSAVDISATTAHLTLSHHFEEYTGVSDNWTYPATLLNGFPEAIDFNIRIRKAPGSNVATRMSADAARGHLPADGSLQPGN